MCVFGYNLYNQQYSRLQLPVVYNVLKARGIGTGIALLQVRLTRIVFE